MHALMPAHARAPACIRESLLAPHGAFFMTMAQLMWLRFS